MFLNNWKKLKNCHKISKGNEMIDISDKPELQLKVPNNSGDAVLIKQINTNQCFIQGHYVFYFFAHKYPSACSDYMHNHI